MAWRNKVLNNPSYALLALSAFFLPLYPSIALLCAVALMIFLLFRRGPGDTFRKLISLPGLYLFILMYLAYVTGMLWTSDVVRGVEDLVVKLPLLLFPILFAAIKVTSETLVAAGRALIAGIAVALFFCLINSVNLYSESNDPQKFFYTSFSIFLHPTYFTIYINLALLLICRETVSGNGAIFKSKAIRLIVFFFFFAGVILLNARLAMTTTFITLLLFAIAESIKAKRAHRLLPRFLLQAVAVTVLFFTLIKLNNRFVQVAEAMHEKQDTTAAFDAGNNVYYNSTTVRVALFRNSLDVIGENYLVGVGTGDVIPASIAQLKKSNLNYLAENFTGAHNQYLQTAMTLGIPGLLLLIVCICFPLLGYIRQGDFLGICFVIIVLITGLGDTILRASSLNFFAFFGCFLYVFNKYRSTAVQSRY